MNSPLAQQYSSSLKENAQYPNSHLNKTNILQSPQYISNSQTQNQPANTQNRLSSLAGLKSIVNPSPVMQNPTIRKGSQGANVIDSKQSNMNFSQGYIGNGTHSQQQQQQQQSAQLSNHQRSFSNSKLLQQKYVSHQSKNNSIQNQTNSNTNMNSSDYIFASNYSSSNPNNANAYNSNQNQILPNNQSVNHQYSSVNNNQNQGTSINHNHFISAIVHNQSNNESGIGQQQQVSQGMTAKNTSPPKNSSQTAASNNTAFNLFKHSYLKPSSTTPNSNYNSNNNHNNGGSSSTSTNTNSNINSTSSKNLHANISQQSTSSQQHQLHNNIGKNSINMKQRQTYQNMSSTPKQATPPSGHQGQLSSYQSIDKQSHLQSIEKIKEDINKKLILQQQINAQIGNSNQNSNGSKSSTPQGVSNKMSSSNSEHKNNSTAATNNILLSINNQSSSMSRKVSNGAVSQNNQNSNINSFINNSSNNNHIFINSSKNSSLNMHHNHNINQSGSNIVNNITNHNRIINESSSLNATSTILPQSSNPNIQQNSANGHNSSFTNVKGDDNSSTNIIFEKVKKRKMNNLSIGNQHSPHQISISQPQSHLSSQKNLQYIIQNKSPSNQTPSGNNPSVGSNAKGLSKTMSFSGHQNNFYSTNCYIKSPQLNQNSGIGGNSTQNQSIAASMNQSAKIKNKKVNSNHDVQTHINAHNNQGISALINNQTHSTTTPLSIGGSIHTSNPILQKINFSLDGPGSTSGNTTNHPRNSSSSNLSPKLNKENLFMESQLNLIQNNTTGIGNLNTMNGSQLQLKDPKIFFKNATSQYNNNTNNGKGLLSQWNSQNTTPTNSNQITYPTLNGQSSFNQNQKSTDGAMSRQSNNQVSNQPIVHQYPPQNQSLNSSYVQQNSQQTSNQQQQQTGNLNNSFWSQQMVNNKIILNKLENFDLENTSNPIDHISEIASLLLISLQETPLSEAIKQFEENVQKINQENKQRQRQVQHKLNQKIKEVEILQQDLNSVQKKLSQKENEMQLSKGTSTTNFNKKKLDQQTQTSSKKKQQNNKNSVIQICDQNGNVQEVDTDKENEMLKDYILEQEKKVNQFKEKESKMIKLLLAVKKRGIDIDDIYNNDVVNDDSNDEIQKHNPPANSFPVKKKRNQIDPEFFKKLDNEYQYADNSIVNDSDESSFGFYGKPSDRDRSQTTQGKPQKTKIKQAAKAPPRIPQKLQEKFKQNLQNIKKQESEEDDEEDENKQFHQNILSTLQITQEQLDQLQEQIQKDPNNLTPEQIQLIQQIHQIQQQHEKQQQEAAAQQNMQGLQQNQQQQHQNYQSSLQHFSTNNEKILNFDHDSSCTDQSQLDGMQSNILPSDLKKQLTTISKQTDDDIQVIDEQHLDVEEEFAKYFVQK